jgi:hypothetical protein
MYKKILLAFVLVALLLGAAYVSWTYNSSGLAKYVGEKKIPEIPFAFTEEGLNGTLMFTLAPKNEAGDILMVPMIHRLGSNEGLIKSNLEILSKYNISVLLNPIFSSDMSKVLFSAVDNKNNARSLFTSDVTGATTLQDLLTSARSADKLAITNFVSGRAGAINDNGDVTYSVKNSPYSTTDLADAEDYEVVLVQNNELQKVDQGLKPKWLDNDHFVYLKNDGVYLNTVHRTDEPAIKIINIDTSELKVKENVGINVSRDGKYLALIDIDGSSLDVYEIMNLDKVVNAEKKITLKDVHGFWPVFSPDGDYLAFQSVDIENIDTDPKPKVVFYSLDYENKSATKLEEEIDLDNYYQDYMYIDGWIEL